MNTSKCVLTYLVLIILPVLVSAQTKIAGTYICSNQEEYMQIDNNAYKIIRTQACVPCMDLSEGDSLASYGSVEYVQDGFIRFKSENDSSIYKNTTVEESYDTSVKEGSVRIRFVFPFKGKYRIDAALSDFPYMSTEGNCITIPKGRNATGRLNFDIYNLSLKYNGCNGEYLGRIVFCDFPIYEFKNLKMNSLIVTIPNLTNSFYASYLINREYAKVEKDKIIWRNRIYKKISNELITPKIEVGERAIDELNRLDIIDEVTNKKP